MSFGKYFALRSKMNGMVVDLSGSSSDPGTPIVTWHAKDDGDNDNQLWYEHHGTGTIRSKLNDHCFDLDGDIFVVNPYSAGKDSQRWKISDNHVQHRENASQVMDIAGKEEEPGAKLLAYEAHGGDNQHWTPSYQPPKYFCIKSIMNDMALDISGADSSPGANVITYPYSGAVNQTWYENQDGVICSKLNDFAVDASSGRLKMEPYDSGNHQQQWVVNGDRVQHKYNDQQVWDIVNKSEDECAEICAWEFHGADNQLWKIEYV